MDAQRARGEDQPPSDERSEHQGGRKPRSLRHGGPVGARESGLRRGDTVGADGGGWDGGAAGGSAQAEREVCPICGGAGYLRLDVPVGDPSFGQPVPCECKERENEERRRRKLDHFSSLKPFNGKTFETFDARDPRLREAFEIARQYAREPEGWLVLRGNYGTGKTHLAAAIAHERLAAGTSVFFAIVPDLLDHLRGAFAPSSEVTYSEMFDDIREVELLVLDDLGTENATAWATEKLFQLINYRYNYHMPTVITTNDRINARMDERIRSRLSDIAFVQNVALDAPDRRPRNLRPNGANGPNGGHGANGSGGQGGVAAYGNGGYGARGENVELDERQQRYERRGGASERPSDRPRGRYER